MIKQYLLTPTCLKCGSFFNNETLFCSICFKNEIVKRYRAQRPSHLGEQHIFMLSWNKGESDVLSQMVYRLKSDTSVNAWRIYAKIFYKKFLKKTNLESFQALIPVPGSGKSSVHAHVFANELSKLSGIPAVDALVKKAVFSEQKNLSARERKQNTCITLRAPLNEHFTRCIFVDDIVTTGESFLQSNKALNGGADNLILSLFYRPRLSSEEPAF